MRKHDVFGRKSNPFRPFFLIILVFAIVLPGYFLITNFQQARLDDLTARETLFQTQIDTLLAGTEDETYHEIGMIIQHLPNTYDQGTIANELTLIMNLAGLGSATEYSAEYTVVEESPFDGTLPDTIEFVLIELSMTIDDPSKVLDYIENLLEADTLYYIETMDVLYLSEGGLRISMILYTFYNDVILD